MRCHSTVPGAWFAVPWALAGAVGMIAPWLLGGRAAGAREALGALCWLGAAAVLWAIWIDFRDWRHLAEYEARRGRGRANPLRMLGKGLLWTLPLWLFVGVLGWSALNPAYVREGAQLVRIEQLSTCPVVVDPAHSRPGIYFLMGLLTFFGLLVNPACLVRGRWLGALVWGLLLNALLIAAVGFWYTFNGNGLVLGRFEPVAHYFFGTFFYKNHWAAYAILYASVAAGLFFREVPRWRGSLRGGGSGLIAGVILLILGLTLPVADSRSGMLLFAVLSGVLCWAVWRQLHSVRGRLMTLAGALLFAGIWIALTLSEVRENWERTEKQMAAATSLNFDGIRFAEGPRTCWAMLEDRPIWGWGYASFKAMFLVYATDYFRDEAGGIEKRMEFAHNDWLQHLAEFGWAGAALLLAGIWLALRSDDRGRTSSQGGWIGLGALLMAVFAGWDFPLSNPAVLTNAGLLLAIWKQSKFTK